MYTTKINISDKDKLYRSLDSYTRSFIRRGVTIMVQAHSDHYGNIDIQVNGKQGIAHKTILIGYDTLNEEWLATCDGVIYHLLNLKEISLIVKTKIQKLSTVITKL